MKVAQISDPHFFHFTKSPLQFFSKAFLANFYFIFSRKKHFDERIPYQIVQTLKREKVRDILISGDLTTSSSHQEFDKARAYFEYLKKEDFDLLAIPGNHDQYTLRAEMENRFYRVLSPYLLHPSKLAFSLEKDYVAAFELTKPWWLVLIDCSVATPLTKSTGRFHAKVEENLIKLLDSLPEGANVHLVSHFPYTPFQFPTNHLERGGVLKKILTRYPSVRIYSHGHTHRHEYAQKETHLVVGCGSISQKKKSSFQVFDYSAEKCIISRFHYNGSEFIKNDVEKSVSTLV